MGERGEYRQVTRDDHLQDLSPEDRRLIEREERIPPKHDPEAEETLTPAEKMAQDMQRAGTNLEQTIENEGLGAATSEVEEATGAGFLRLPKTWRQAGKNPMTKKETVTQERRLAPQGTCFMRRKRQRNRQRPVSRIQKGLKPVPSMTP